MLNPIYVPLASARAMLSMSQSQMEDFVTKSLKQTSQRTFAFLPHPNPTAPIKQETSSETLPDYIQTHFFAELTD